MDEKQESNLTKEFRSLPQHVMDFLKSIDKDDTILVISDCDKMIYNYLNVFDELSKFLFAETHHMTVRVGGNSFRFAKALMAYLRDMKAADNRRFEFFLSPRDKREPWIEEMRATMTVHFMSDYKFDLSSDFMRYVKTT